MTSYAQDIQRAALADVPWGKLDGCNILITGATGLIGSCLVDVLMAHDDATFHVYAAGRSEQRAQARFSAHLSNPRFHFLRYDVTEPVASDVPFHFIVHAASGAAPQAFAHTPVEVMKSNIIGTLNLLDYGLAHGLRRLLYVSSGEVYGQCSAPEISERDSGYVDPTKPRSCYPSSKRAAETLCASFADEYGADVVIARPAHIYGPHFTESDNRVYAQFIRNVLRGEDIVMKSDGSQLRSWCYVVDCATAILHILLQGAKGEAYNISDNSSAVSIKQLAEMVAEIGGCNVVMDIPKDDEKKGYNPVTRSVFLTDKLEAFGWKVSGTMHDKMASTIAEARNILKQ